jgi:hypothetical protein
MASTRFSEQQRAVRAESFGVSCRGTTVVPYSERGAPSHPHTARGLTFGRAHAQVLYPMRKGVGHEYLLLRHGVREGRRRKQPGARERLAYPSQRSVWPLYHTQRHSPHRGALIAAHGPASYARCHSRTPGARCALVERASSSSLGRRSTGPLPRKALAGCNAFGFSCRCRAGDSPLALALLPASTTLPTTRSTSPRKPSAQYTTPSAQYTTPSAQYTTCTRWRRRAN